MRLLLIIGVSLVALGSEWAYRPIGWALAVAGVLCIAVAWEHKKPEVPRGR